MIFTARQLQEKCQEQNVDLHMTFVDLPKAFDTVSRDRLWKIMAKFGCPPIFIAMVRHFHDGMQARVQNDGEFSEPFEVTMESNRVVLWRQHCSAWCFLPCSWMLFRTVTLVCQSGTVLWSSRLVSKRAARLYHNRNTVKFHD